MNKWLLIHSVGGEGLVCAGEGLGSLSSMHGLWGMRLGAVRIIRGHLGYLGLLLGLATLIKDADYQQWTRHRVRCQAPLAHARTHAP